MKKVVLAMSLISSVSRADFGWLEGEWVSDAESSLSANPYVSQLGEDVVEDFKASFGRTVWIFSDGMFTAVHSGTPTAALPYSIRPIDIDRFEICLDSKSNQITLVLWQTESGFCAQFEPDWSDSFQKWIRPTTVECYIPVAR